jgi:hypothetical protein
MSHRMKQRARVFGGGRRGFTLLELTLASSMGLLVIFVAFGVFSAMRAGWDRSQERHKASLEMFRLRSSLQEAFRGVIVLPKPRTAARTPGNAVAVPSGTPGGSAPLPPPGTDGTRKPSVPAGKAAVGAAGGKGGAGGKLPAGIDLPNTDPANAEGEAALVDRGPPAPRLILEQSPLGVQRLELVVSNSPSLAASADKSWMLSTAEAGGGVRGAFELRPSTDGPGYDIWWRTYPIDDGPEAGRVPLGEVRIARGFTALRWSFVKSDDSRQLQWLTSAVATDASELPAYVELEAETRLGLKAKWMFEVNWVMARAQDTPGTLPAELAERYAGIDPITGEPVPDAPGKGPGNGPAGPDAVSPNVPPSNPNMPWQSLPERWRRGRDGRELDPSTRRAAPWSNSFGADGRPVVR